MTNSKERTDKVFLVYSCNFKAILFIMILTASILCSADERKLHSEIQTLKSKISEVDGIASQMSIDKEMITMRAKEKVISILSKQSKSIKSTIQFDESDENFFDLHPSKTHEEIEEEINDSCSRKIDAERESFTLNLQKEKPLIESGIVTSIKTRKGILNGRIIIERGRIKVGSTIVYMMDIDKSELPRFNKEAYKKWCNEMWMKNKNRKMNAMVQNTSKLKREGMLKGGYLPMNYKNQLSFDEEDDVRWFTRQDVLQKYKNMFIQYLIYMEKEKICWKLYGVKYTSLFSRIQQLNMEIEIEQGKELARKQEIQRSGVHVFPSSKGLVCADCAGTGKQNVWIAGAYRDVKCKTCNGSGQAGLAGDYLDEFGRHRSVMEQVFGGAIGAW